MSDSGLRVILPPPIAPVAEAAESPYVLDRLLSMSSTALNDKLARMEVGLEEPLKQQLVEISEQADKSPEDSLRWDQFLRHMGANLDAEPLAFVEELLGDHHATALMLEGASLHGKKDAALSFAAAAWDRGRMVIPSGQLTFATAPTPRQHLPVMVAIGLKRLDEQALLDPDKVQALVRHRLGLPADATGKEVAAKQLRQAAIEQAAYMADDLHARKEALGREAVQFTRDLSKALKPPAQEQRFVGRQRHNYGSPASPLERLNVAAGELATPFAFPLLGAAQGALETASSWIPSLHFQLNILSPDDPLPETPTEKTNPHAGLWADWQPGADITQIVDGKVISSVKKDATQGASYAYSDSPDMTLKDLWQMRAEEKRIFRDLIYRGADYQNQLRAGPSSVDELKRIRGTNNERFRSVVQSMFVAWGGPGAAIGNGDPNVWFKPFGYRLASGRGGLGLGSSAMRLEYKFGATLNFVSQAQMGVKGFSSGPMRNYMPDASFFSSRRFRNYVPNRFDLLTQVWGKLAGEYASIRLYTESDWASGLFSGYSITGSASTSIQASIDLKSRKFSTEAGPEGEKRVFKNKYAGLGVQAEGTALKLHLDVGTPFYKIPYIGTFNVVFSLDRNIFTVGQATEGGKVDLQEDDGGIEKRPYLGRGETIQGAGLSDKQKELVEKNDPKAPWGGKYGPFKGSISLTWQPPIKSLAAAARDLADGAADGAADKLQHLPGRTLGGAHPKTEQ